jgi:hypothetical protein
VNDIPPGQTPPPGGGQPPHPQPQFQTSLLPSGPDRPSPVGLALSGVGLLLLAVGSLIPHLSLSGEEEALEWLVAAGFHTGGTGLPGLAPALVLLVLVVWTAAGVRPNLMWAAKLGGIGLAVLTAAASLHPVIEANSALDAPGGEDSGVSVSAGGGVWLYIIAAILLAVSIFMMRWAPAPPQAGPAGPPPQAPPTTAQPPAGGQQPPQQNGWPQVPPQQN